jgi:hypothetical protein
MVTNELIPEDVCREMCSIFLVSPETVNNVVVSVLRSFTKGSTNVASNFAANPEILSLTFSPDLVPSAESPEGAK